MNFSNATKLGKLLENYSMQNGNDPKTSSSPLLFSVKFNKCENKLATLNVMNETTCSSAYKYPSVE